MSRALYLIACTVAAAGWAAETIRRWWVGMDDARLGEIE